MIDGQLNLFNGVIKMATQFFHELRFLLMKNNQRCYLDSLICYIYGVVN